LAIYHLNANVISRARGQSIVAAAAYRAGARLRDERYGVVHNYVGKHPCAHAEIMAPEGTPDWVHDRELLWNRVEAAEQRKDSQLARVIEIGLPVELSPEESLALVREYAATVFVARGMIADFCIRRDNPDNPRVHILLTLRVVTPDGFGPKERRWNGKANLIEWRAAWAERANLHLARAGHAERIDHRTLEAQQIELTPARRMGGGGIRGAADALPSHLVERIAEQRRIARANGDAIIEDPSVALRALTHGSPTFTQPELERFLRSRTENDAQSAAALIAVTRSAELVALAGPGEQGRFTSRDMIEAAQSLRRRVRSMANRATHSITSDTHGVMLSRLPANTVVRRAFEYLLGAGAAKALAVRDDANRSVLLDAVVEAWTIDGLQAVRLTPRMLAGTVDPCPPGGKPLVPASVLLIEDADMIGLKQLERAVAGADHARAKAVLIGDPVRLGAMGGATPFSSVLQELEGTPG